MFSLNAIQISHVLHNKVFMNIESWILNPHLEGLTPTYKRISDQETRSAVLNNYALFETDYRTTLNNNANNYAPNLPYIQNPKRLQKKKKKKKKKHHRDHHIPNNHVNQT